MNFNAEERVRKGLEEAQQVLTHFIATPGTVQRIAEAAELFSEVIRNGGKIIAFGNGGSMSDAMHFAEELSGRFRDDRRALPAIAVSDPSHITCTANDYGFESIFSRFVEGLGKPGDAVLAISTSGNSANVVKAAKAAKDSGLKVVALTGKTGGELASLADVEVRVEHQGYSDRIQEVHIKVIHLLIEIIEKRVG
jgi:D-sedoheptulose 7-phosphate isomerase